MSDKTKSVTGIGFVSDKKCWLIFLGLVRDKTKSVTCIGFVSDE